MRHRIALVLYAAALATLVLAEPAVAAGPTNSFRLDVETGTWEPLREGSGAVDVVDAVALANGDIAVFGRMRNGDMLVEVYSPETGSMTRVALDGTVDSAWGQFVLGPDGRLYSAYWTIDPSVDPWHLESSTRVTLVFQDAGSPALGIATNGLGYLLDATPPADILVEVDLATDTELGRSSPAGGMNWWVVGGEPRDRVYLLHLDGVIASYDPADGSWREESIPYPEPQGFARDTAAFGPDGRIYALDHYYQPSTLWAWDSASGEWQRIGEPPGLSHWYPELTAGGGYLYAFAGTGEVAAAAPPNTAMPAPGGPAGRSLVTWLSLLALLLALTTTGLRRGQRV